MDRVILHVDMNAFYASVETLDHPEAAGVPMAVCGDAENRRGIILAKNELAKAYGIKTAEPIWQAQRKCPRLLLLPPHREKYAAFSRRANEIYERFTDLVEPASIDESYLDVTGSRLLFGDGVQIADRLRAMVKSELRLTVSVGVSFCKIFAKMGSDYKKPDATTLVSKENYQTLLYPLPVTSFMYVGGATAKKLEEIGVATIGDLARLSKQALTARLGKHGALLYKNVHGLDDEPVRRAQELEQVKSVGNSLTYKRDLVSMEDVRAGTMALAESVGARLRVQKLKCRGVQITIKDPSFNRVERQTQLSGATHVTKEIYQAALQLILREWTIGKPIRLLSVTAINLADEQESEQLNFFENAADNSKLEALDYSMDEIRAKFGKGVLKSATALKNDLGI